MSAKHLLEDDNLAATSGLISEFREFTLSREDEAGMIFISCDRLPDVFIAVKEETSIRSAIDTCLRSALEPVEPNGLQAHVFTNGSVAGPKIHTVVKLTK